MSGINLNFQILIVYKEFMTKFFNKSNQEFMILTKIIIFILDMMKFNQMRDKELSCFY